MGRNTATLTFAGDTSSLERAFGRVQKSGSKLGHALATLGKAGAVAGFVALAGAAKLGWDEFAQGQKVTAQTQAALKSTGAQAGVTKKSIQDLAGSLMALSGTDDEAIQSSENLLLTFTNIKNAAGKGNDIFNQSAKAALDLSVAFGKDLAGSSVLVGKALNDPIKGISALSRVGVSFTAAQKETIKAMVASGNTMGAQKLILAELTKETGGSAAAFGKTLPGQISIAKEQLNNFLGGVMAKVVPVLLSVVNWIRDHWPQISAIFKTVFDAVRNVITIAVAWIRANVVPAVQGIIAGLKSAWEKLGPIVMAAFNAVKAVIEPVMRTIKAEIETIMAVLSGDWGKAWAKLKEAVVHAFEAIWAYIKGAVSIFQAAAKVIGTAIWDGIKAGLAALLRLGEWLLEKIVAGIKAAAVAAYNGAVNLGRKLVDGVIDGITSIPGRILDALNPFGDSNGISSSQVNALGRPQAAQMGLGLVEGVASGVRSGQVMLGNAFSAVVTSAVAAGKRAAKASSPSKLTAAEIGLPLIQGVALGVTAGEMTLRAALQSTLLGAVGGVSTSGTSGSRNALLAKLGLMLPTQAFEADPLSKGNLAMAMAQLTPQIGDDLGALQTLVTEAEATLKGAAASGSAQAYLTAANALKSARDNLAALGPLQMLPDGSVVPLGGMTDTSAAANATPWAPANAADSWDYSPYQSAGASSGGGASGGSSGSGNTYYLNVTAIDPASAGTAVIQAIDQWEQRNGQRYARA